MDKKITLTLSQKKAFDRIIDFANNKEQKVFILRGYAGTGKTTITKLIIEKFSAMHKSYKLCASTGRAAKILADATHKQTSTIHSLLYTFNGFNDDIEKIAEKKQQGIETDGQLYLVFNSCQLPPNETGAIYVIDEASMIGDKPDEVVQQAMFGSGKLLSDLLHFDPAGKFIFIGDNCQLPPVKQNFSPALSEEYFRNTFDIDAQSAELTQIMRQTDDNDIIEKSAQIRKKFQEAPSQHFELSSGKNQWVKLPWRGANNIKILNDYDELVDKYVSKISNLNYNQATYITPSNRKCLAISQRVRNRLGFSDIITQNELLLVTQNNLISGLMNGDLVKVINIEGATKRAGLTFQKVTVKNLSNDLEYTQYLIIDILCGCHANLTSEQQKDLFIDFAIRMKENRVKADTKAFNDAMNTDPYLNALRCLYGYALTCHKSQGGEWPEVFLEPARNITRNPTKDSYQWLYTAMTRAKQTLYMANDFYLSYPTL